MAVWDDYVRSLEFQIEETKRKLIPYEEGRMQISTRESGGDWRDITKDWIAQDKATIATLENILREAKKRL